MTKKELKPIINKVASLIDEKKGENIIVYDLDDKSSLCDYIIIATANSAPHLNAMEEFVSTELKQNNLYKLNRDGGESNSWRVSDYGSFLLHLMTEETRAYYALDKMFSFAKIIDWTKKTSVKKTTKKPTKKPTKKVAKKVVKLVAKTKKVKQTKTKTTAKKTTKKAVKKVKTK